MANDAKETILISVTQDQLTQLVHASIRAALQEHGLQTQIEEEILDVKGASAFTKIPVGTLYNWTSERKIPFFKPGKQVLFSKLELLEWMKEHRVKTHAELTIAAQHHLGHNRAA